jgi:phage shock protein PspC (stress-responsive transcriptional regulator)
MRRVVTISLNGNAYALEDDAADAVSAYLESARMALAGHADLNDILSDLEQAIAEKSQRYLGPHKTVLNRREIDAVLAEMGPVEADPSAAGRASPEYAAESPTYTRRRRLYRIKQGQMLAGVCNGLAAYFGVDVSWVRLGFLVFALCWGLPGAVYLGLILILPVAQTPEEVAAAHGEPFNAREYVERARREAASLANRDWQQDKATLKAEWEKSKSVVRNELRDSLRRWRAGRLDARRRRRAPGSAPAGTMGAMNPATAPTSTGPGTRVASVIAALLLIPLLLVFGGLAIAWVVGLFTLVTTGAVFGLFWPAAIPIWAAILLLWCGFALIAWPFRLLGHLLFPTGGASGWGSPFALIESLVGIAMVCALLSWGYHHIPALEHAIDAIQQHVRLWLDQWPDHGVKVET